MAAATVFGIGYVPLAPGTVASLAAVGMSLLVKSDISLLVITLACLILSFLLCGRAEKALDRKDPKEVVIDDFSGQLIALLFIPQKAVYIFIAFLLFRVFDTVKIPPADIFDREKGSLGIVGDDIVAGLYANLLIQLVRLAVNISS